jgi:hypothetical protein
MNGREIHIHVEEPSMEAFLNEMLPRYLDPVIAWKPINYGSKHRLLNTLPTRLRGYANIDQVYRPKSLILVDRDDDDCLELKNRLEIACREANLTTRGGAQIGQFIDVVNRIVVEELEAWYFGDIAALLTVWPGVPATLGQQARFRNPDAVSGGTHETLLSVLQRAGHFKRLDRLPKIDAARRMGKLVEPDRNQSHSFQTFLAGLQALVAV